MEHRYNNSKFPTRNWKVSFYTVISQLSRVGTLAHDIFIIFKRVAKKKREDKNQNKEKIDTLEVILRRKIQRTC